jgi:FkbM family methyltransferase
MNAITRLKSAIPLSLRQRYWSTRNAIEVAGRTIPLDQEAIGRRAAWILAYSKFYARRLTSVRIPGQQYPLYFRPNTSDAAILRQIFVRREYDPILSITKEPQLIVDCGANIGLASRFLLAAFPRAHVVVVEPDKSNMALCRKNLRYYGDQVTFVEAGIWAERAPMKVVRGEYRDGSECTFQVRPCSPGEASDFNAVTIEDVLAQSGRECVDILKMDIEASEQFVFQGECQWLDKVKHIAIELHDALCEEAFFSAMRSRDYELAMHGDLHFCTNINRVGAGGVA